MHKKGGYPHDEDSRQCSAFAFKKRKNAETKRDHCRRFRHRGKTRYPNKIQLRAAGNLSRIHGVIFGEAEIREVKRMNKEFGIVRSTPTVEVSSMDSGFEGRFRAKGQARAKSCAISRKGD